MKKYRAAISFGGFSLVEILVVLGLFSSIATLALGSLFNAQSLNGRLQETQAILDNINLSMQTITRDIRFGSEFYATTSVPVLPGDVPTVRRNCEYGDGSTNGCSVLVYKSSDASNALDRTVLYLDNGVLYEKQFPHSGDPVTLQMTANNVSIDSLIFYVEGAQTSDGSNDENSAIDYKQPMITLLLSGVTKSEKTGVSSVPFNLQTVISARDPDNK
jgi:prepilin-type N-terminal cleavage/methylation domain-containing protein